MSRAPAGLLLGTAEVQYGMISHAWPPMGADLRSAVSMSHLRELPPEVLDDLLVGSTRMTVPAGSVTHWEGEPEAHLELVLAGVVRVFVTARDGRTMTVRYCRPGALLGVMSLFATGSRCRRRPRRWWTRRCCASPPPSPVAWAPATCGSLERSLAS
jgi:hypothetical protein